MIYILTFCIAAFLVFLADITPKNETIIIKLLLLLSIFVLSTLAGLRSEKIGTDLLVYVKPIFYDALYSESFNTLVEIKQSTEIGYLLFNFLVSRFTDNFNVLLFFLQFTILFFLYKGLYKFRDKFPMWMGLVVFLLIFYNRTLNIIRQGLAVFIIFSSLRDLYDKKYSKYIISVLIAYSFHSSAILMLPLIFVLKMKNKKLKLVLYATMLVSLSFYNEIIEFLVFDVGILTTKYLYYLSSGELDINFLDEAIRLVLIGFLVVTRAYSKKYEYKNELITSSILDFLITQVGIFSTFATRLSWYFFMGYIVLLPYQINNMKKNKELLAVVLIFILTMYWLYNFAYLKNSSTYPYESILGNSL